MGTLGIFLDSRRFIIGGKGLGLLTQVVDLLDQVGQLVALCSFLSLCRVIVGGEGFRLLTQAVDLLRQVGQLGILGGFLFGRCKCSHPGFQGVQVLTAGQGIHLGCQRLQVARTRLIGAGELVGLLAQGIQLLLHGGHLLALGGFLGLCRVIVGGENFGLLAQAADLFCQGRQLGVLDGFVVGRCGRSHLGLQSGQVVMGGEGIQLGRQRLQVVHARLIGAGECVGLLVQGDKLLLNSGNLLALGGFPSLCRFVIGRKGRGLLVEGLDLLRQSGQLGILGGFIIGRRKGSHPRLQGRELVGLFLLAGGGLSVGVLQGCHAHLIGVPGGGVLAQALLDRDNVNHQENDNGEKGQRDGPVEQRFQEGRHLRTSFLLRHTRSPLRDDA